MLGVFKQIIVFVFFFAVIGEARSESTEFDERVFVVMRSIGHEFLLASGDSTSLVMPVGKVDDRYKLEFENDFLLEPALLTYVTDSLIQSGRIATGYIMEVLSCDSNKVVYSYQVGNIEGADFMPCSGRPLPESCYYIMLRLLPPLFHEKKGETVNAELENTLSSDGDGKKTLYYTIAAFIVISLLILGYKYPFQRKTEMIPIGRFLFDQKHMILKNGKEKQDLTGKESDLLNLLYRHLNSTVDRDVILKEVWRNEGDYIGRTLDVYISKLRKKFEADPSINIINVRGVGYKMTLD